MILDLTGGSSEIGFTETTFPDGQPHVSVDVGAIERAPTDRIDVITRLRTAGDIVRLALVIEALRSVPGPRPRLAVHITYLLGARMDRRIAPGQPDTLAVLLSLLDVACREADEVTILDPHSPVTLARWPRAKALHPDRFVAYVLEELTARGERPVVVIPDKGAIARTSGILERIGGAHLVARCSKVRDPHTGALSGFHLDEGDVRGRRAVIVDDICDGGGTFAGIAAVVRAAGATEVSLAVTHGVFSRGPFLSGVDRVYATDSYGLPEVLTSDVVEDVRDGGWSIRRIARDGALRVVVLRDFVRSLVTG